MGLFSDYANTMRTLSCFNCGIQSLNSFINDSEKGDVQQASKNFAGNIFNGFARNEAAYDMQSSGYSAGNDINLATGYGNAAANTVGTLGMMSVYTPWMLFNSPYFCNYNINYNGLGFNGYYC